MAKSQKTKAAELYELYKSARDDILAADPSTHPAEFRDKLHRYVQATDDVFSELLGVDTTEK